MMMPLELFIAVRYLRARRNGVFTLLTTLISVGGITLGVAALIITLAVMSGFHRDIREKILGLQPHIIVVKEAAPPFAEHKDFASLISADKDIQAVAPFVYGQILLRNRENSTGAVIKGIDWQAEDRLVHIAKTLKKSTPEFQGLGKNDILIGSELSRKLRTGLNEELILMSPGQLAVLPKMEKYRVTGIFHSGMYEYDDNLAFIALESSQKLFDMQQGVTGLGLSLKDPEKADSVERRLNITYSYPYSFRSWQRMNKNLFSALKLEKIMMFIILVLIILVAAFNIISNLLLLTVEKSREIGILSALGLSRSSIGRIFFYEGFIVGLSGITFGLIGGLGLSLLLKKYQFIHLPAEIYYIDTLPVRIVPMDIASVIIATFCISLIAVLYPAYVASKLDPIETIRYG